MALGEKASLSYYYGASLAAQRLKRLPGRRETQVRSLGQEDPLEQEMATHSSSLTWRISRTEEPAGYSPWSLKESDMTEQTCTHVLEIIWAKAPALGSRQDSSCFS